MADWSVYAGRWVALTELREVVGVGLTPEEARQTGRLARVRERLQLAWVSPYPPHLLLPEWPLVLLRPWLPVGQVWLVGGTVRDLWLGRTPHDWDFAVAGAACSLARRVADALGGAYVTLDEEHDTGRVVVRDPLRHQPITLDFARIRGVDIEADLRLRDFTVNALALTWEGELVDPTGGQRDLVARQLVVTGPQAFSDDPARLLRAVRIAGELDFRVAEPTAALIRAQAAQLAQVAGERLGAELVRLLRLEPVAPWLQLADRLGVMAALLPEVCALQSVQQSRPHVHADAWSHTLAALTAVEGILALVQGKSPARTVAQPAWAWERLARVLAPFQAPLLAYLDESLAVDFSRADLLKWGLLFHDVGKASTRTVDERQRTHFYGHAAAGVPLMEQRLTALRFPRKALDFVAQLVGQHMRLIDLYRQLPPSRRAVYRFYQQTGEAGVAVVLLALADTLAVWGQELEESLWRNLTVVAETLLQAYFDRREEVVAPPPLLTGRDLLALGFPAGPQVGRLLAALREAQAAGDITTRDEAEAWVLKAKAGG